MTARNFYVPGNHALNTNGIAIPGATASLYTTGTTTPAAFYSDAALSVSLGSTITANGAGRFPTAYGSDAIAYRLILKDKAGTELDGGDIDPFYFGTNLITSGSPAATPQDYGALADGVTDDTAAFTAVFAANSRVHFPAGTYIVSAISIPANTVVTTDGFDTIIKQKSGTAAGTRIISIDGSNVNLGDLSIEGQLNQAGDTTGEQNHGIFIYIAATDTVSRSNITIDNVKGTNIRGDVVCTGVHSTAYTAGYRLTGITAGKISGANIYRNVVSVTAGSDISIESITGTQVGYLHFDAEQDVGSGPIIGLSVGYIKGRNVGLVGPTAADYIDGVSIGTLDLDPAHSATSSPAYGTTTTYGLQIRNLKHAHIEKAKINGFNGPGLKQVYAGGELAKQTIGFGELDIASCCLTDAVDYGYVTGAATVTRVRIETLRATISAAKAALLVCDFAVIQSAEIANASTDGAFRTCANAFISNLNHTGAGIPFIGTDYLTAVGGTIAATGATLCSFSTAPVFIGYTATVTTVFNAVTNGRAVASTLNAVFSHDYSDAYTITSAASATALRVRDSFVVTASDETTALTTGNAKITFRMPYAFALSAVRASLSTAQVGGSIFTVDLNEAGSTILSTKLTIDNGEKTSTTAATPPVISDTALADDAEITVDIDQVGDGTAKGLKIMLIGERG